MTWTGAFGRSCRVLLDAIVRGLALTKISPNVLTFIGLVINIIAAILFGYANSHNYQRMFLYAGLVIIGAGIFDMVDGRVARATNQVTTFGGFFDSVIDRYSEGSLLRPAGLLRSRQSLFLSGTGRRGDGQLRDGELHPRPRRIFDWILQGGIHGASRTDCAGDHRRAVPRWGAMAPVLWVIAVLSTITVIHRIAYTYQQTRILDEKAAAAAATEAQPATAAMPTQANPRKARSPASRYRASIS